MQIRQILTAEDRQTTTLPLRAYAFDASPPDAARKEEFQRWSQRVTGDYTLIAEDAERTLATVSAIRMRQNVRGAVLPMTGIAGVASHPLARRQGHVRSLLNELHDRVRDEGDVVATLYPFRPSFYARFSYVGLPKQQTVTFAPAGLASLLDVELPGEVSWCRIADGYPAYRELTERMLTERHGFAVFPDYRAVAPQERNDRWLVTARAGGEVVGALTYRIDEYAGQLTTDPMMFTGPLGRALLLRFLANHIDQVTRIVAVVPPEETPELWATDLEAHTEARVAIPHDSAPMARVLSVDGLAGMPVGPGRIPVEIVDDRYLTGRYLLDGDGGQLDVRPDRGTGGDEPVRLTAAGFSALVYGVLDPVDVAVRGLGTVDAAAVPRLRSLFPRRVPFLSASF